MRRGGESHRGDIQRDILIMHSVLQYISKSAFQWLVVLVSAKDKQALFLAGSQGEEVGFYFFLNKPTLAWTP